MRRVTRHHLIPMSQRINFPAEYLERGKNGTLKVWTCVDCHTILHRWFSPGELATHLNTVEKLKANWLVKQWLEWKAQNPATRIKDFRPIYQSEDGGWITSESFAELVKRVGSVSKGSSRMSPCVAELLFALDNTLVILEAQIGNQPCAGPGSPAAIKALLNKYNWQHHRQYWAAKVGITS